MSGYLDSLLEEFTGATIVFGTGHRPQHLGGFTEEAREHLHNVALRGLEEMQLQHGKIVVVSGMALGWDTALVTAAIDLGIPYIAAVPFIGQEARWSAEQKLLYFTYLMAAKHVIICNLPGYEAWKLLHRNKVMIDMADVGLALYDESKSEGGTAHAVREAVKRGVKMYNAWDVYLDLGGKVREVAASYAS